ncbi:MAG: hypothetical protein ABIA76_03225 [Candidatus Diapherotrites archaeon]
MRAGNKTRTASRTGIRTSGTVRKKKAFRRNVFLKQNENFQYRKPKKFKKLIVDYGFGSPRNLKEGTDRNKDALVHGHEIDEDINPRDIPFKELYKRKIRIKSHSPNIRLFYNSPYEHTPLLDILKKYQANSVDEWRFNCSLHSVFSYEQATGQQPNLKKTAEEFFRVINPGGRIFIMYPTSRIIVSDSEVKKKDEFIKNLTQTGFDVKINNPPNYDDAFTGHPQAEDGFRLNQLIQIIATKPLKK